MRTPSYRRALLVAPLALVFKLTACADQVSEGLPKATPDPDEVGGGGDAGVAPTRVGAPCTVTKGSSSATVYAGTLLLPETVADGEVMIGEDGIIACAGTSCASTPGYDAANKVKCTDVVISPGLINTHDHIGFANNPPKGHGNERYEHRHDWRKGTRAHTKISVSGGASADVVRFAELRFVMSGATATAGAGGQNGLLRNLDTSDAQMEGNGLASSADSDTFPLKDSGGTYATSCASMSTTRMTTSAVTAIGASGGSYLAHVSEGIDEPAHLEFTCQSENGSNNDIVQKPTAIVHGIGLDAADVAKYNPDQAALIWSPRSNVDLYGNTASVVLYDNLGVPIALGTDWVASGSMNLLREVRCADDLNKTYFGAHFSDKALWKMVTLNAAFAVGAHRTLGQLRAGFVGDIALFDANAKKEYRAVLDAGVEDVVMVVRGGKVLYGSSDVLDQSGSGGEDCEAFDVCKVSKKACVAKDISGASLAQLRAAGEAVYPLFFCKDETPTSEPSCTPRRGPTASSATATAYSGEITATDKDGDGIADGQDNCPTIFNPIRPMDVGVQPDADGDGLGDACDKCPLASGETCTPPRADDIDADGVADGEDNCAETANGDQVDGDGDGKGDACDLCPALANPGAAACPVTATVLTVEQIRNPAATGHPTPGNSRPIVQNVYVTAVRSTGSHKGFVVQTNLPGAFQALFVRTEPTAPTVVVGNKVDVVGDYIERFGLTTLQNPAVTVTDAGTTLPFTPRVVTTAQVDEGNEGMLCRLDNATVTTANADAPDDYDELIVTSGAGTVRVDDEWYEAFDNNVAVNTAYSQIIGICGYSFTNRKLWPRSAADIVP